MVDSKVDSILDGFITELLDMSLTDYIKLCDENKIDFSLFYEAFSFTSCKLFMQVCKK